MAHLSTIAFWLCWLQFSQNANAFIDKTVNDVHINHLKTQAFLVKDNKPYCGASVIGDKLALTAAHCVIDANTNDFEAGPIQIVALAYDTVNMGSDETRTYRYVEEAVVPVWYYQPLFGSDIAVLKLHTGFSTDSGLRKLAVPSTVDKVNSQNASIARFGLEGSSVFLGTGHQDTGVLSEDICRDLLGSTPYPHMKMCSESVESADERCQGNGEGGGLVLDDKVIGVLSYERPCDESDSGRKSIYTKVSMFSNWINTVINGGNVSQMRVRRYPVD